MDVTNLRRIGPPITAQSIPSHFTRREKGIRRAAQFSRSSLNQVKSPRRSHISELFLHRRHIKRIVACVQRCQGETFRVQFHLTLHDRQPRSLMVRKRTSGNVGSKIAMRIAPKYFLRAVLLFPNRHLCVIRRVVGLNDIAVPVGLGECQRTRAEKALRVKHPSTHFPIPGINTKSSQTEKNTKQKIKMKKIQTEKLQNEKL